MSGILVLIPADSVMFQDLTIFSPSFTIPNKYAIRIVDSADLQELMRMLHTLQVCEKEFSPCLPITQCAQSGYLLFFKGYL